MIEAITNAVEELKRLDHLIYVSLKYTRTVDVLRNVVNRLMEMYEAIMMGFLGKLEEENQIVEIPLAPKLRVELIKKYFSEDEILMNELDFYLFLRKVYRAKYTKREEFRRHVTMTSILEDEGREVEINIDIVLEYFEKSKEFVHHIKDTYVEKKENEE